METSLESLAAELVRDPFNAEVRQRYAQGLLEQEDWEAGLEQFRLLAKQAPSDSTAYLGAARCLVGMKDHASARMDYERARGCPAFAPDEELERILETAPSPALRVVTPSANDREEADVVSISTARQTRFVDIVGMEELKQTIRLRIVEPFLKPGLFARFKKRTGGGILLYGPPGCGKTLIARAIASECEATFLPVGISDILNMWIGESERNLALLFEKARANRPAVLFFDELDALAFSRSKATSEHTRTLVNEFLSQLDGLSGDNEQLLVLAATNMPWDVDIAMKRPGRFDRQIFVPPPDDQARAEMFRVKLVGVPVEGLDYGALGQACPYASGADIDGLIEQAKDRVLGDIVGSGKERPLRQEDLLAVTEDCEPSTLDWLRTARNLVKYGGGDRSYKDVEKYLKRVKL